MKRITALLLYVLIFQVTVFAESPTVSRAGLNLPYKVTSYDELKHQVRETFARGEERMADAVERERVRTNWEVGKLIDEHIFLHKERAEYGKQVIKRLSADLKMSQTQIKYMVQFARSYPIGQPTDQLSWAHYIELLSINDDKEREKLAEKASKEKWSTKKTRSEIIKFKSENPNAVNNDLKPEQIVPMKGKLNTYRIVSTFPENLRIDLGFSNYLEIPKKYKSKFKEGDIVILQSKGSAGLNLRYVKDATQADLFTYQAKVLEVTDGDTIWLFVDLGFGISTKQHIRLRGINTPEIITRDGQVAKAFVEQELACPVSRVSCPIIITTSKSDKYDRYLADVYYIPARDIEISAGSTRAAGHGYQAKSGERFLNNELLKQALAERV